MQSSPSCSPSLMSTGSTGLYHAARILYDANRNYLDLADLYRQQRQLTIRSTPLCTRPIAQMSSNASFNASNENRHSRHPSRYLLTLPRPQHRSPSPRAPFKPHSRHSLTSIRPYSGESPMDSSRPSPTERLTPPSLQNGMKITSTPLSSESCTTRIPSTSHLWAMSSTTGRSATSTSLSVVGYIRKPSGSISMTMGQYPGITQPRDRMSNHTSLTYMWPLITASTCLLNSYLCGSATCSLGPEVTFKSSNKLSPTLTTGALCYCEIDDNIASLATGLEEYQWDIDSV
jgi:hypothetical protein